MPARSTMTRAPGQGIGSAHLNALRDHIVPSTTTDDVSTQGQMAINTTSKRLVVHDGTSAVRVGHYSATGRTWFRGILGAVGTGGFYDLSAPFASLSTGVQYELGYSSFSSSDAWLGTPIFGGGSKSVEINAPVDGIYAAVVRIQWAASWPIVGDYVALTTPGETYYAPVGPVSQAWFVSFPLLELTAGQTIRVYALQSSGSSQTINSGQIHIERLHP